MKLRSWLLYLAVAITLGLGLLGLLNPLFTARLLGLEVMESRGLSQVRATFGALHIALGAVILVGASGRPKAANAYLRVAALLVAAVALGRFLSIVIDGAFGFVNLLFLVSEVVVLAGVALAGWGSRPGVQAKDNRTGTTLSDDAAG